MKVHFVTGNSEKVASMREHVKELGIDIEQVSLVLIEPQASDIEPIAFSKARQAFDILRSPVLVEDSAKD